MLQNYCFINKNGKNHYFSFLRVTHLLLIGYANNASKTAIPEIKINDSLFINCFILLILSK